MGLTTAYEADFTQKLPDLWYITLNFFMHNFVAGVGSTCCEGRHSGCHCQRSQTGRDDIGHHQGEADWNTHFSERAH